MKTVAANRVSSAPGVNETCSVGTHTWRMCTMDTDGITPIGLTSLASRGFLDPVCLRADEKRLICSSTLANAPDRKVVIARTGIDRSLLDLAHKLRKELTSAEIASMAARGIDNPSSLSWGEIRSVCASVLAQVPVGRAETARGQVERPNPRHLQAKRPPGRRRA